MISVSVLKGANERVLQDIEKLLSQLHDGKPSHIQPSLEQLQTLIADKTAAMIVARDGERVVGMAVLFEFARVGESSGYIDDVIVDEEYRGQGVATKIMEKVIATARDMKLKHLDLTSRPSRAAANKLYQKLGFEKRQTNPYRLKL